MLRACQRIWAHAFPGGDLRLEERFYRGVTLVGAFLAICVVIPVNAFQTLPWGISAVSFSFGLMSLYLYVEARRGCYYPRAVFASLLVTLTLAWFPDAGSDGSIAGYFLAAGLLPVIFFRGLRRWSLFAVAMANCLGLVAIDSLVPSLRTPFHGPLDRALDLASGFAIAALAAALMLVVVMEGYHNERRRLEETLAALAESREHLSLLFQLNPDAVCLSDAGSSSFLDVNAGFEAITGWSKAEAVGRSAADLNLWADQAGGAALVDRLRADGRVNAVTCPLRRRDGHEFVGSISARALDVGGRRCVLSTTRDVTELKRAEADRARLEGQLMQAQKMESLGNLAGGVAHAFNNMLGGIVGHADLLLDYEVDQQRQEQLEAIQACAIRAGELTRKLLAFAERGRNVVEPVDMRAIVRDSLVMLRPSLGPDVAVETALPEPCVVDGDPSQLSQMIVNLCQNANEAMPHGGLLRIAGTVMTADAGVAGPLNVETGDCVELTVSDSGVGIPDGAAPRIFEPFFTTKAEGHVKGSGLGLAAVHGIVHLHRGTIRVQSVSGCGTIVTICLPRSQAVPPAATPAAPAAVAGGLVLVVDDEEMLLKVFRTALHRLGYLVMTAADGVEAVELFAAHHRELAAVILDLKMPRKPGREAFLEMQAVNPRVPVLVCSGYGDNEEAQELLSQGAWGLLPKPFRLAELASALTSIAPQ